MHIFSRSNITALGILIGGSAMLAGHAQAVPFTETFESFSSGDSVGSSTPDRNQGTLQENWFVEDGIGGTPIDQEITALGRDGGNALRIGGSVGSGVTGITSPSATPPVGESGTTASFPAGGGSTVAGTAQGASRMNYSFDFRTFATESNTDDQFFIDFGVADLTSRLGWVRLSNFGGDLGVEASDYSAFGVSSGAVEVSYGLTWGSWYTMSVALELLDGPDNDIVTYSLFDNVGALVSEIELGSWEGFYGSELPAVHQMSVQVNDFVGFSAREGEGVLIDNVKIASVPEPGSLVLLGLGLAGLGYTRRKSFQGANNRF